MRLLYDTFNGQQKGETTKALIRYDGFVGY